MVELDSEFPRGLWGARGHAGVSYAGGVPLVYFLSCLLVGSCSIILHVGRGAGLSAPPAILRCSMVRSALPSVS